MGGYFGNTRSLDYSSDSFQMSSSGYIGGAVPFSTALQWVAGILGLASKVLGNDRGHGSCKQSLGAFIGGLRLSRPLSLVPPVPGCSALWSMTQ